MRTNIYHDQIKERAKGCTHNPWIIITKPLQWYKFMKKIEVIRKTIIGVLNLKVEKYNEYGKVWFIDMIGEAHLHLSPFINLFNTASLFITHETELLSCNLLKVLNLCECWWCKATLQKNFSSHGNWIAQFYFACGTKSISKRLKAFFKFLSWWPFWWTPEDSSNLNVILIY